MTTPSVRTIRLPAGDEIPALGQGTWGWAEDRNRRDDEIAALRCGLDLGMTLVDTAEMYADGAAEELLAEAIDGRRDEAFLVSKVLPSNASRRATIEACEGSLRRLGTDRLDLYLLHWRSSTSLHETLQAFEELVQAGKIRHWGVSNFDARDLDELAGVPGSDQNQVNQVLYNLTRRGPEYELIPKCQRNGIPIMAYSPIEQGRMLDHTALRTVADRHGVTPARVGLSWVLRQDGLTAIPRASSPEHLRDNLAALDLELTEDDLAVLDDAFPPPVSPQPLEVL